MAINRQRDEKNLTREKVMLIVQRLSGADKGARRQNLYARFDARG